MGVVFSGSLSPLLLQPVKSRAVISVIVINLCFILLLPFFFVGSLVWIITYGEGKYNYKAVTI